MVWPKSGSITSSATSISSIASAIEVAGISGRFVDSANSHAATTTKAGFAEFGGLDVDAEQRDPASGALDLGAEQQRRHDQRDADRKHDQRGAADLLGRQEGNADQHDEGRQQEQHVTAEEMEGIKPDPRRHRRACRQRQDHAGQHQREDRGQSAACRRSTTIPTAACVLRGRASMSPMGRGPSHWWRRLVTGGLMEWETFEGSAMLSKWSSYPAKAGIQYAAASRFKPNRLWNTGSPLAVSCAGA